MTPMTPPPGVTNSPARPSTVAVPNTPTGMSMSMSTMSVASVVTVNSVETELTRFDPAGAVASTTSAESLGERPPIV